MKVPDLPLLPAIPAAGAAPALAETPRPAGNAPPAGAMTALEITPGAPAPAVAEQPQSSLYSATRLAVQAALDRGELSQALLLLSDWYGDPSLSPAETQEVNLLLSQLAGSVIYSTEHRLEPPYMVQAGEGLQGIAQKYDVPWQLLAKINGLSGPEELQPGKQLKVVRGPFSALVDLSQHRMTLMLDRRYAGQFAIEVDPTTSVEEGHWTINQKLITPGNVGLMSSSPSAPSDQKSIMMTNTSGGSSQIVILRGSNGSAAGSTDPAGRVIRLKVRDVEEVYDILSLGSSVVIRR
jgi:LysM repeat protein